MLKIALSGNIASGKTLVQEYFEKNGIKTLCLDEVTKKIYLQNKEFQEKIFKIFNTSKKEEIAKTVFNSFEKLKILEKTIYPYIESELQVFFTLNKHEKAVMVAAPVLFESGFDRRFDKIIFVSSEENLRLSRLMKRNGFTEDEAKKRIQSQEKEENKIKKSDFIIYNNSTLNDLYSQCEKLIKELSILL